MRFLLKSRLDKEPYGGEIQGGNLKEKIANCKKLSHRIEREGGERDYRGTDMRAVEGNEKGLGGKVGLTELE